MMLAFIASLFVACLSFLGALFSGKSGAPKGTHRFIVPIAIGVFLGVVFFELIPEALSENEFLGSVAIVSGFLGFFLLSHLLRTYHHHHTDVCDDHTDKSGARLVLVGDGIHNVADGIVIATAFLINPTVGIATTLGIALHEIPQEIVEFSILLRAGYTKRQAMVRNALSALSIVFGVLLTYLISTYIEGVLSFVIGIAAGNLLYIAATDLLPEVHEEHAKEGHFAQVFFSVLAGLIFIAILLSVSTH